MLGIHRFSPASFASYSKLEHFVKAKIGTLFHHELC